MRFANANVVPSSCRPDITGDRNRPKMKWVVEITLYKERVRRYTFDLISTNNVIDSNNWRSWPINEIFWPEELEEEKK